MRTPLLALLLFLGASFPAWSQQTDYPTSGVDMALRLLRECEVEQNIAFSPVSLQTAFAMVAAGARGETRDELVHGLALGDNFLEASKTLAARLAEDGAEISLANRLWPDSRIKLHADYVKLCREYFGATPESLNFHDTERARQAINSWVSQRTSEKIAELLRPGSIDNSTILVLTNALYFKGRWKTRFDPDSTEIGSFYSPAGPLPTPLMTHTASHAYYEDANLFAVGLDYLDSNMRMTVLVPRRVDGWKSLREELTPELLQRLQQSSDQTRVQLVLPRFQARSSLQLIPALRTLGVEKAFGQADLAGIAPGGMAIGQAIHEAVVEVDEEGTVAAAATAVAVTRSATSARSVTADRPFLFTISDSTTGAILFIGQVVEPEKAR